jgi:hypothetical protein
MNNLPLLKMSKVAAILARIAGYLYTMPVTRVPSLILLVNPAKRDKVVQPSSIGSSGFPIIPI